MGKKGIVKRISIPLFSYSPEFSVDKWISTLWMYFLGF